MKETTYITKGIRKLSKVRNARYLQGDLSVCLGPAFAKTSISYVTEDGKVHLLPISKKVAEVLIASGVPYQG